MTKSDFEAIKMKKPNRNISVEKFMATMIHHMCDESGLEFETVVERVVVDDEFYKGAFINDIRKEGNKIILYVCDYIMGEK